MNRVVFFDRIRQSLYGGRMTETQVRGVSAVLAAWDGAPTRYVAYGLATAFAEVGKNMQPVREGFKTSDAAARAHVKKHYWTMKSGKPGYGRPAGPYGHVYYGRGYVQLTWLANYQKAGDKLGIDLVRDPDRALEPDVAARIMREGMEAGWFTGKKLSDYLTGGKTDYKGARRIINKQDRAGEIAGYALAFEAALRAASYGKAPEMPVVRREAEPAPVEPEPPPAPPDANAGQEDAIAPAPVTAPNAWARFRTWLQGAFWSGSGAAALFGADWRLVAVIIVGGLIVTSFAFYHQERLWKLAKRAGVV